MNYLFGAQPAATYFFVSIIILDMTKSYRGLFIIYCYVCMMLRSRGRVLRRRRRVILLLLVTNIIISRRKNQSRASPSPVIALTDRLGFFPCGVVPLLVAADTFGHWFVAVGNEANWRRTVDWPERETTRRVNARGRFRSAHRTYRS